METRADRTTFRSYLSFWLGQLVSLLLTRRHQDGDDYEPENTLVLASLSYAKSRALDLYRALYK